MTEITEAPVEELDDCLVCVAFNAPRPRKPRAGFTCGPCLQRMRRQLKDLPELYVWAGAELLPGSSTGARGSERSIGLRVGALDLRWGGDVLARLTGWARIWREDFALVTWVEPAPFAKDPTGATLVQLVRFVDSLLGRVSLEHLAVDEFARELADIHGSAVSAARTAPREAWVVSCPADHGSGSCGKRLRVTGEDFGGEILCRGCGTSWDVMRLLHVSAHDKGSTLWLPAEEVGLLYGVKERTLRDWAARGLVRREHGRYDAASVREAMLSGRMAG